MRTERRIIIPISSHRSEHNEMEKTAKCEKFAYCQGVKLLSSWGRKEVSCEVASILVVFCFCHFLQLYIIACDKLSLSYRYNGMTCSFIQVIFHTLFCSFTLLFN